MPCESCSVQFSVFKRKRICGECDRYYCSSCLLRGGGMMCGPCRVLSTRPLGRQSLSHLKVRDLQYFLHRQNVSTRGCVEKEDLVNLAVTHVNSGAYRRRPPQQNRRSSDFNNPFSSLKGITTNINNFLNTAFDIRPQTTAEPPRPPQNTQRTPPYYSQPNRYPNATQNTTTPSPTNYNATARTEATGASTSQQQEGNRSGDNSNTTSTPTSNPVTSSGNTTSPPELIVTDTSQDGDSTPSDHRDTADCLEIEDCDDAAEWEFIRRPAEPLPPDSNVLFAENSIPEPGELTSRAASELDLRRSESNDSITETSSLKDEPVYLLTGRVQLEDLKSIAQLETLNVKQLKELLALNRVDFKGCVERKELMERAKRLWKESAKSREELNNMSADELCKICMDAPLECVLLECGHMASCTACGKRLSECPICRQYVVRVVRFFRS